MFICPTKDGLKKIWKPWLIRLGCFYVTAILSWGYSWVWVEDEVEAEVDLRLTWTKVWFEVNLSWGWGWVEDEVEIELINKVSGVER